VWTITSVLVGGIEWQPQGETVTTYDPDLTAALYKHQLALGVLLTEDLYVRTNADGARYVIRTTLENERWLRSSSPQAPSEPSDSQKTTGSGNAAPSSGS
jgi:hypothetical protein